MHLFVFSYEMFVQERKTVSVETNDFKISDYVPIDLINVVSKLQNRLLLYPSHTKR